MAGIADADVLPFDWRDQVAEFSETLDRYQSAAGGLFDLTPATEACASLARTLDTFYSDTEAGRLEPGRANAVIQGLARILVPINYTRMPRFRHDPATPIPPLPTVALAVDLKGMPRETLGFAQTQLVRGQTRFIAALREAEPLAASP